LVEYKSASTQWCFQDVYSNLGEIIDRKKLKLEVAIIGDMHRGFTVMRNVRYFLFDTKKQTEKNEYKN